MAFSLLPREEKYFEMFSQMAGKIEEAAGITKYKTKRRAAELKLEETQQNLLRIDDTLSEVTRNLNSLKRQASKARRHKELADQLSLALENAQLFQETQSRAEELIDLAARVGTPATLAVALTSRAADLLEQGPEDGGDDAHLDAVGARFASGLSESVDQAARPVAAGVEGGVEATTVVDMLHPGDQIGAG